MTVSDLVTAAIQRLTGDAATPSQDDIQTGLLRLNDLIDAWKIEGLTIAVQARTTWTLTSATSYTIGSGGTINIDRPINAQSISFGLLDTSVTPNFERPMVNITEDDYTAIAFKTLTAPYPQGFYYDPTSALGAVIPYPIPTASLLKGVIYAPSPAGEVVLSDTLTLPQGYRRFYRDNLALELGPDFQLQPNPALVQSAVDSKANVKRANVRMTEMVSEAASLGGGSAPMSQSAFYAGQ